MSNQPVRLRAKVRLIPYREDGLWSIKVKNPRRVHQPHLGHLKSLLSDYPECWPLMLHPGTDRLRIDGIPCGLCEAFLRGFHPDSFPEDALR